MPTVYCLSLNPFLIARAVPSILDGYSKIMSAGKCQASDDILSQGGDNSQKRMVVHVAGITGIR